MSAADRHGDILEKSSQEPQNSKAEVLDTVSGIIDKGRGRYILTDGGVEIPTRDVGKMGSIKMAVLKPVTPEGNETLNKYVKYYESGTYGVVRQYKPVTALPDLAV